MTRTNLCRREAAYALGKTRSQSVVPLLIDLLVSDKKEEVRGAAAVALGKISNEAAVPALAAALGLPSSSSSLTKKGKKTKREQNPFVLKASARALGQIGSRIGVPALIATLQDEKLEEDVRREVSVRIGSDWRFTPHFPPCVTYCPLATRISLQPLTSRFAKFCVQPRTNASSISRQKPKSAGHCQWTALQ